MSPHITQLPISRRALGPARSALTALTLLSATLSRLCGNRQNKLKFTITMLNKIQLNVLLFVLVSLPAASFALNPIIQTIYTADPTPVVREGLCYLYVGHDEDVSGNDGFTLKDWRCFTSTDMVNWTDHGVVATLYDFKWAGSGWDGGFENGAWALQCIEQDGKWYMYCPMQGRGIGVLVSTNGPFGPFSDPIGKPLIGGKYDSIDPAVFIDKDGQAYLCWVYCQKIRPTWRIGASRGLSVVIV